MRTLHKKFLTTCLALTMALALAVPAFADSYRIQSAASSSFWNVATYNGSVALGPIQLSTNGCFWEVIFDAAGNMKLKCPYAGAMGQTLVASADSSSAGSLVIVASNNLPPQHSSVDIKTIGNGMSRIYFNQIDKYATQSGSQVRIMGYNESNNTHKWYLHA